MISSAGRRAVGPYPPRSGHPSGITAQGLLVYAQNSIQIGTIGIAQIAQPALAVVWAFLLLEEVLNARQMVGIAIVMGGLLAFTVLNQRGGRRGRAP